MPTAEQTAVLDEVQVAAKRIFDSIVPELLLVEQEFERQAQSNIQVIAYLGDYAPLRRQACAAGSQSFPIMPSVAMDPIRVRFVWRPSWSSCTATLVQ
jgi:hypothetical protein